MDLCPCTFCAFVCQFVCIHRFVFFFSSTSSFFFCSLSFSCDENRHFYSVVLLCDFILLHLWRLLRLNFNHLLYTFFFLFSFSISMSRLLLRMPSKVCTFSNVVNLPLHWFINNDDTKIKERKKKKSRSKGTNFYLYMCLKNWHTIKESDRSRVIFTLITMLNHVDLKSKRPWRTIVCCNLFIYNKWMQSSVPASLLCFFFASLFCLSIHIHVTIFDWSGAISAHSFLTIWRVVFCFIRRTRPNEWHSCCFSFIYHWNVIIECRFLKCHLFHKWCTTGPKDLVIIGSL